MADVDLWPCEACTFLNHPLLKSCEVCETPRGKDGSASPFYPSTSSRTWSSPSTPSFLTSSSTSLSSPPSSPASSHYTNGLFVDTTRTGPEWDEVGQRLDICRKRDYRFLSLEALSLTTLPASLAESLATEPHPAVEPPGHSVNTKDGLTKLEGATDELVTVETNDETLSSRGETAARQLSPVPRSPLSALRLDGARLGSQLTALFLNDNNLTEFPVELARLSQLRELHLHYNQLTTLPPCIGELRHLEKLFLSHNALHTLPAEMGRLTALQMLSLFNNHLTSVPPELGQLRSLHSLFLNDNALTSVPPQLFDKMAGTLTVLQLNANKLTSLPPQIGRMFCLKKLNVEGNALVTLPASLALLGDLSVLAFRRNLFHYAVSGTWNVSPPSLLHLACAAVRSHIRTLAGPPPGTHLPSLPPPSVDSLPPAGNTAETEIKIGSDEARAEAEAEVASPITALYEEAAAARRLALACKAAGDHGEDNHDARSVMDMVLGLNITEDLKKLLLEGEGVCSVCGRLLYGDGNVVRVFPMELVHAVGTGGSPALSFVSPAGTAGGSGVAAPAPAGGTVPAAAVPAPLGLPTLPASRTSRPKVMVRGTYCSWLCAKRQVPQAGSQSGTNAPWVRPDRAIATLPPPPPPPVVVAGIPIPTGPALTQPTAVLLEEAPLRGS